MSLGGFDAAEVIRLLKAALEKPPQERRAFLRNACRSDSGLREEIESLLSLEDDADRLFERHPAGFPTACGLSGPATRPETIGSYRILDVIGEGGAGIVYRAQQQNPRREVALKVIKAGLHSCQTVERFEQEAEVLGCLRHPGIAQIFEASYADIGYGPLPFFVMELLDGRSVTDFVESHNFSTHERLRLFLEVCDAVEYAHQSGIVHRDLKPSHILVGESGQPKILDFGVARVARADIVRSNRPRTDAGQVMGTIPYMSPEQFSADPGEVDSRSDVYALGVILFEMLSKSLPYDIKGRPIVAAHRIICEEDPIRLGSVDKELGGDVETVVAGALEKDKRRRHQSVDAFAGEIRRLLAGKRILTRSTAVRNIPFERNPFFTGRWSILEGLHARLAGAASAGVQAISGLGGVGKTQLALEYAHRYSSEYHVSLWVKARSRKETLSSFVAAARCLGCSSQDDPKVAVTAAKRWFDEHDDWLLVVDGANRPGTVAEFIPGSRRGHVIITSRAQNFRELGIVSPLVLEPMTKEEAIEFLFKSTDADRSDAEELHAAETLAGLLGFLPLALEQMAAVAAQHHLNFAELLGAYRKRELSFLADGVPRDYDGTVVTTWSRDVGEVQKISEAASELLRLSAFLRLECIPFKVLERGRRECGPIVADALRGVGNNPLLVNKTLEPLTRYSLIDLDPKSRSYSVHPLVRKFVRDEMGAEARKLWAERSARVVKTSLPRA